MRHRLYRIRLRPDAYQLRSEINLLTKIIDDRLKEVYVTHWTNFMNSIKMGPTAFKKIKNFCKSGATTNIKSMIDPITGGETSSQGEIANIIGNNFYNVHQQNDGIGNPVFTARVNSEIEAEFNNYTPRTTFTFETPANASVMFNPDIHLTSVNNLKSILKSRANKRSTGHDEIPNVILRKLSHNCIVKITTLFNQTYNMCYFPTSWKLANIIPIRKPDKPENQSTSYRPISLLPCLSKVYEKP